MLKRILGFLTALAFAWSLAIPVATPAWAQSYQADNVQMSVNGTPGTGTITLGSAVADHLSFAQAAVPNGATVCVWIQDSSNAWEIDHGVYTSSGPTLTRSLLWSSTGSLLSLSSAAVVSIVTCAEDTSVPSGHIAIGQGSGYPPGDSGVALSSLAPIASPALTGTPTAPTQSAGDTSTKLATDQFVEQSEPGGFVNLFRNPAMDVWQRGVDITVTTSGAYTADGWFVQPTGASVAVTQDSSIAETIYQLEINGATGVTDVAVKQPIESYIAARMASQTVTVQFEYVQNSGSAQTPKVSACYASGQDNFSNCTSDLAAKSLTSCPSSTECFESYAFPVTANAGYGYQIKIDCNFADVSGDYCAIGDADIRVTPGVSTGVQTVAPPPELPPINYELEFCQRYYETLSMGSTAAFAAGINAAYLESDVYYANWYFKQRKRATPTFSLTGSWSGTTPTITPNLDGVTFGASALFYTGGAGFIMSASAELTPNTAQ